MQLIVVVVGAAEAPHCAWATVGEAAGGAYAGGAGAQGGQQLEATGGPCDHGHSMHGVVGGGVMPESSHNQGGVRGAALRLAAVVVGPVKQQSEALRRA